jgi:hypothetical protein
MTRITKPQFEVLSGEPLVDRLSTQIGFGEPMRLKRDSRRSGLALAHENDAVSSGTKRLPDHGAHSAKVETRLLINGASIPITHMGRDFVVVVSPADYPPCEASLFLKVDDSESRWKVRLPEGLSKASKRVALALAG